MMIKSDENSARNIESCSVEIRKCVSVISATTERVDALEKGVAKLEA